MSWYPHRRSSKFRHVYGKAASKENCYDGIPITQSVHDNHFCAVNPHFIAVVTECAGGGAFLVIPINQTGKLDPHYPRICGHKGNVLDIKWSPFNDFVIASCSEDATLMNIAFSDMNPFPMKLLQNRRSAHRLKLEAELKELDRIKAQYVKEHSEQAAAGHLGGAVSEEEEET